MCLIDSFKKTDTEFLQKASAASPSWKDGTTAVCVLLLDETLYVANLGDSKVVLCRKEGDKKTHLRLSKDHSPAQVSLSQINAKQELSISSMFKIFNCSYRIS